MPIPRGHWFLGSIDMFLSVLFHREGRDHSRQRNHCLMLSFIGFLCLQKRRQSKSQSAFDFCFSRGSFVGTEFLLAFQNRAFYIKNKDRELMTQSSYLKLRVGNNAYLLQHRCLVYTKKDKTPSGQLKEEERMGGRENVQILALSPAPHQPTNPVHPR